MAAVRSQCIWRWGRLVGLNVKCADTALALYWNCTGAEVALYCSCSGPAPVLYEYFTGTLLVLDL